MKKTINWNELTPACYAIAEANGVALDVARGYVKHNVRDGKDTYHGAETLPGQARPDWAKIQDHDLSDAEGTYDNGAFNVWVRTMKAAFGKLDDLWQATDYAGMVALMDATADPGPIDGIKPGEDVPTPLGDHE